MTVTDEQVEELAKELCMKAGAYWPEYTEWPKQAYRHMARYVLENFERKRDSNSH